MVQAANLNDLSSDAFLVLPTSSLGTEYIVMSYVFTGRSTGQQQGPSTVAIIALEDLHLIIEFPSGNDVDPELDNYLKGGNVLDKELEQYDAFLVRVLKWSAAPCEVLFPCFFLCVFRAGFRAALFHFIVPSIWVTLHRLSPLLICQCTPLNTNVWNDFTWKEKSLFEGWHYYLDDRTNYPCLITLRWRSLSLLTL